MIRIALACALTFGAAFSVSAQQNSTVLLTAPGSVEGVRDYCLYAGLAYSRDALLTVDIPNRRESPEALQKRLMKCTSVKGEDGLVWENYDVEQRGTSGN